jgi:ubiquinone/menaquinone biosynthesis C-methylase UbiE
MSTTTKEGKIKQEPEEIREAWDTIATGFDEFVTPYSMIWGEDALRRINIQPGAQFLDVAAGSGAVSIPAARLGAEVVAVDISPKMIERLKARAKEEGIPNLDTHVMDGQALRFSDNSFDLSASLNGVSLFPEMSKGLSELVRVTRPGGKVVIIAFGSLHKAEWLNLFMAAVQSSIPDFTGPSMDPPPLPFQVADPGKFRKKMAKSGLKDIRVETITSEITCKNSTQLWDVVTNSNPIGAMMVAGLNQEQRNRVRNALDDILRKHFENCSRSVLQTDINIGIGTK